MEIHVVWLMFICFRRCTMCEAISSTVLSHGWQQLSNVSWINLRLRPFHVSQPAFQNLLSAACSFSDRDQVHVTWVKLSRGSTHFLRRKLISKEPAWNKKTSQADEWTHRVEMLWIAFRELIMKHSVWLSVPMLTLADAGVFACDVEKDFFL